MDCGGKHSATPLWIGSAKPKQLSPLRSASAFHMVTVRNDLTVSVSNPRAASGQGRIPIASPAGRAYNSTRLISMDAAANRMPERSLIAIESSAAAPHRPFRVAAFLRFRIQALLLVAWLALPAAAAAGPAFRFDMFVGYDGVVPQGSWFPIAFEVFNDGDPFIAKLEVTPNNFNSGQTRSMFVELPRGTIKRFSIPVYNSASYNPYWTARLRNESGRTLIELPSQQIRRLGEPGMPLAGAITRTAPTLPELKNRSGQQPVIARLLPDMLPDNPIALEGLDTIYLASERLESLKAPQITALQAWLHAGGHLVVGVEQFNHFSGPGEWLGRMLPAEITGISTNVAHAGLHSWLTNRSRFDGRVASSSAATTPSAQVRTNRRMPIINPSGTFQNPYASLRIDSKFEDAPLQAANVKLRDGQVVVGTEAEPLIIMARRGRGQITMLTFAPELEPFKSWRNGSYFWAKVTDYPSELLVDIANVQPRYGGRSIDGVFGAMVDSDQVRKLPVHWLLLLLVLYLAVIGPVDQYWLKKINKQMLTWITFPIYVAFFSALIYFIGYKLRAGESEWNELHVIDIIPHGDAADLRGWTFGSIYSPVNAKYRVASEQPFATLRSESSGNMGGQDASKANVEQRGNTFHGVLDVPVWTSQLFVSDWWGRSAAPFSVSVTADEVTIDNHLETRLLSTRLVVNGEIYDFGDVPARKSQTFRRSAVRPTSLSSFVSRYSGSFNSAINARGRAFGDTTESRLPDKLNCTAAASFVTQLNTPGNQWANFSTPPGFDLNDAVQRGDAVVLAFASDYAPVKPLNQFTARRNNRSTLFRMTVAGDDR